MKCYCDRFIKITLMSTHYYLSFVTKWTGSLSTLLINIVLNGSSDTFTLHTIPTQRISALNPANTPTLNYTPSTFINVVSTLIFGRKWKLSRRTFMDVVSKLVKQRWNNVDRISRFNGDETMLFQRWNLVENESWADLCLSTLFQRWQNNVETTLT